MQKFHTVEQEVIETIIDIQSSKCWKKNAEIFLVISDKSEGVPYNLDSIIMMRYKELDCVLLVLYGFLIDTLKEVDRQKWRYNGPSFTLSIQYLFELDGECYPYYH